MRAQYRPWRSAVLRRVAWRRPAAAGDAAAAASRSRGALASADQCNIADTAGNIASAPLRPARPTRSVRVNGLGVTGDGHASRGVCTPIVRQHRAPTGTRLIVGAYRLAVSARRAAWTCSVTKSIRSPSSARAPRRAPRSRRRSTAKATRGGSSSEATWSAFSVPSHYAANSDVHCGQRVAALGIGIVHRGQAFVFSVIGAGLAYSRLTIRTMTKTASAMMRNAMMALTNAP